MGQYIIKFHGCVTSMVGLIIGILIANMAFRKRSGGHGLIAIVLEMN